MNKIIKGLMFVLFVFNVYANEKQVTADMLVGKWICKVSDGTFGKRYNSEGKMIELIEGKEFRPIILEYQKKGIELSEYYINSGGNKRKNVIFKLNDVHKSKMDIEEDGEQIIGIIERNYISDNEFQYIVQVNAKNISNNFISGEGYFNFICKK